MVQRNERDLGLDEVVGEEDDSESTRSPVDERLEEKAKAFSRRRSTFSRSSHLWRRNINRASDGIGDPRYSRNGASPIELDTGEEITEKDDHWGTNRILDYFGFSEGEDKNKFLRGFDGEYQYGADVVRAAFQVAGSYNLMENYGEKNPQGKKIFIALANSVHRIGELKTDLFIERVGIENMPLIMGRYSTLKIDGHATLVPAKDLGTIVSRIGEQRLSSPIGPDQMLALGYTSMEFPGAPVLFYHRDRKPSWI